MSASKRWKPPALEASLAALSDDLDSAYAPERALLTSGLNERIIARLPRPVPALCRCARLLWLAVLIGSLTVIGLATEMLLVRLDGPAAVSPFRALLAIMAAVVALALATLAPRIAAWEAKIRARFFRQAAVSVPATWDVLMVRIAALALLAVGGVSVI